MSDTILAVSTGLGRAAIAIIRLSGTQAGPALAALAGPLPSPRRASLRVLRDRAGEPLDHALVLWFAAPASATGEDCAELHVHGGRAVVDAVLAALCAQSGCRMAEPGEFTRRAFLNGRLDLPGVEGLADLIDAETDAQRRQALRQQDGVLAGWVARQRRPLLDALAAAESAIDFSDEADVAGDFAQEVQRHAADLDRALADEIGRAARAAQIRDGFVVALTGPPNAGKSTLLNALARREVAIVSPYAGTTRDPVEVRLDLGGYLVTVVDTAGLRPTADAIEQMGVTRALERARAADLVLWLSEAAEPLEPDDNLECCRIWRIATKADLAVGTGAEKADHRIAATTGDGLPALIEALTRTLADAAGGEAAATTRARHRTALQGARTALAPVLGSGPALPMELAAERLRDVSGLLDGLLGRVETEEVLGLIFARFCVGK